MGKKFLVFEKLGSLPNTYIISTYEYQVVCRHSHRQGRGEETHLKAISRPFSHRNLEPCLRKWIDPSSYAKTDFKSWCVTLKDDQFFIFWIRYYFACQEIWKCEYGMLVRFKVLGQFFIFYEQYILLQYSKTFYRLRLISKIYEWCCICYIFSIQFSILKHEW